jgi:hypothetical protein
MGIYFAIRLMRLKEELAAIAHDLKPVCTTVPE